MRYGTAAQGTYANQKSDTPPGAVETWHASLPAVPGLDALHSFAADPEIDYRTLPPAQPMGEIPSPGPFMMARYNPGYNRDEQQSRDPRGMQEIQDVPQFGTGQGVDEVHPALAPINPAVGARNTGRGINRPITQNSGPPVFTVTRTEYGHRFNRRFSDVGAVSFATNPGPTPTAFGTGQGPYSHQSNKRSIQRVVPTPDQLQSQTVTELASPAQLQPEGSSMQRYW